VNKHILKKIQERMEVGANKYGAELDINDGRDWLQESIEEALDNIVYLSAFLLQIQERINNENNTKKD
tara:strand:- start:622 stop:825 length:204 start_codon:yes stop_codon:yes gene_type:complete